MGWLSKKAITDEIDQLEMPDALWTKCPSCNETLYKRELELNLFTCFKCNYHFKIGVEEYINILFDNSTLKEENDDLKTVDKLNFVNNKPYIEKINDETLKSGYSEAFICGLAELNKKKVAVGLFNFSFMDGSIGSVVGEKFYRIAKIAIDNKLPFITIFSSNGARYEESAYSIFQIAKISTIISELNKEGILFISIIAEPTMGDITLTLALEGDLVIAEPNTTISLFQKNDLEKKSKKKNFNNYPKSEFFWNNGQVDLIVDRKNLKETLFKIIEWYKS